MTLDKGSPWRSVAANFKESSSGSESVGYFKPLRRKIGVVTLVLACVLMAGWIRSNGKVESLRFSLARFQPIVISGDQRLWFTFQRRRIVLSFATLLFPNQDVRLDNNFIISVDNTADCERMIELNPIGMGTFFDEPVILSDSRMFIDKSIAKNRLTGIPYWSIVIPLTLLSVWLLLSKPRTIMESRKPFAGEKS